MTDLSPVKKILDEYQCKTNEDRSAALREIVQELALVGLSRTDFFSCAAFYGGTALRIFHGLERYSEDLDFSLLTPHASFSLNDYLPAIRDELASWGFEMTVEQKNKTAEGAVQSAFIKGGTLVHLVKIAAVDPPVSGVPPNSLLRVKLEIDTDPPDGARFETKYRLRPIPFAVRLYDPSSLFAGKVHAVLCRKWKDRVKGRDFFDYLWYLSNNIPLNLAHLEQRMRQSGHWEDVPLLEKNLRQLLQERFATVNYAKAKADAIPFVRDSRMVDLWSADFFIAVTKDRLKIANQV